MSLISANLNSSASVALKLLIDAATRSANNTSLTNTTGKVTGQVGVAAVSPFTHSNGVRLILSLEAAEKAYGADSFLAQTARGRADQIRISTTVIPLDKAGFKSDVMAFLSENMKKDAGFMMALRSGQVMVQIVDEVPELNIQPYVSFEMYKNGNHLGGGSFGSDGTNLDLYEEFGKTRGQAFGSLGNSQFLAYRPKSV